LEDVDAVACVSRATLADAHRLIARENGKPALEQVTLGLSYPYRPLQPEEARARLGKVPALAPGAPFVLHVGSNLVRKNREGVLRIFARCKENWNGLLVFAGDPLSPSLRALATELALSDRIVEVPNADSDLLEALYNAATALLFPSTFEGFGWPIAEAHACGCPVLCADREPMAEVAGEAGLLHPVEDEAGFAADLLRLTDPAERARWSVRALENAKRFSTARMIAEYCRLYRSLAPVA
jgi:glycosyltransferase involved in cell wall biosynthesis